MSNIFERLAAGPGGMQPQDYQNWNQMVGSAPPEQFGRAAYDSVRQVDPRDYYQHTQPGVGGTDPFGSLQPQQRSSLAGSLLGALFKRGLGQQQVMQGAGVGTLDPNRMSPQDLAALACIPATAGTGLAALAAQPATDREPDVGELSQAQLRGFSGKRPGGR